MKKITPIHFVPEFCSQCGHPLKETYIKNEKCRRLKCARCGVIAYVNPRIVAGAVVVGKDGKVMLLKRGIEPARGLWTYPAGFLEMGETVEDAAVRETFEETGIRIRIKSLIGIYSYRDAGVATVVYLAEPRGGKERTCLETLAIEHFSPKDIPWKNLAFRSSTEALKDWARSDL